MDPIALGWVTLLEHWRVYPLTVLASCYVGFSIFGTLGVEATVRYYTPRRQPPNRPAR